MSDYVAPAYELEAFTCPFCHAYAHQEWRDVSLGEQKPSNFSPFMAIPVSPLFVAKCDSCKKYSVWLNKIKIYPPTSAINPPSSDMPSEVKSIYQEASNVYTYSPRAASALLRLALQKLLQSVGEKSDNVERALDNLVKRGLPAVIKEVAEALHCENSSYIRPGIIDFSDTEDIAKTFFTMLNMIVYYIITVPKNIATIAQDFPTSIQNKLKGQPSK